MSATAETILHDCRQKGIRLAANGDRLHVEAPAGTIDADTRAALIRLKPSLLALLTRRSGIAADSETAVGAEIWVLCFTPAGAPLRIKADSAEHAAWLQRMNPPPDKAAKMQEVNGAEI